MARVEENQEWCEALTRRERNEINWGKGTRRCHMTIAKVESHREGIRTVKQERRQNMNNNDGQKYFA